MTTENADTTSTTKTTQQRRTARCTDCNGNGFVRVLRPDLPLLTDAASEHTSVQRMSRACGCTKGGHGDPVMARQIGAGARKKRAKKAKRTAPAPIFSSASR